MVAFNFGRKVKRVARRKLRRGELDHETYQKIVTGSRDPEMVAKWKAAVESGVPGAPWTQKTGVGDIFAVIWDWLVEHWPEILKIILSLLAFMEPPPQQDGNQEKD
jgi:hypothetical protein